MTTAIYVGLLSNEEDMQEQTACLKRWTGQIVEQFRVYDEPQEGSPGKPVAWPRLWNDVLTGSIAKLIVWRMDCLPLTAAETVGVLQHLRKQRIAFLSDCERFNTASATGELAERLLETVIQHDTLQRLERQKASLAEAEVNAPRKPGRPHGSYTKATLVKRAAVKDLLAAGKRVREIADIVGLSTRTIYAILRVS